jgi:putative cardiolipin synthase
VERERPRLDAFVAAQADSAYLRALRSSRLADDLRSHQVRFSGGDALVVYDRPEKLLHEAGRQEFQLAPQLRPFVEATRAELTIFSPYFVPGEAGTALLTGLAGRGVRVRILTNSLASNDVSVVHAGYAKYRKALLRGGVELYELNAKLMPPRPEGREGTTGSAKASLHAKSFVFDRKQVFIGSMNLDPRAVVHNTEIGVVLTCPEIAQGMAGWFDGNIGRLAFRVELTRGEDGEEILRWRGLVDGEPRTFDAEPHAGFWKRLGVGFLGLFPIESQL